MKKLLGILLVLFFIPQIVFAAENRESINEIKKICPFGISRNFNVMSKYLISCAVNYQKTGLNQQQVREVYKYLADAYYLGNEVQRDLKKAFDNYKICYNMDYDGYCGRKMAEMYLRGDGVQQSDMEAFLIFYEVAKKNDDKEALMISKGIYDLWDYNTKAAATTAAKYRLENAGKPKGIFIPQEEPNEKIVY